jgi:pimeloyl-ACP methyl ester carboxylesterase
MSARATPRIRRGYVNTSHGQVHYRVAGHGPPVVLIPDPPRSSRAFAELLESLGEDFTVLAFDLPGYGNSTPLAASPQPEVGDFARAVGDALAALGLERTALYGFHGGSKIALELAVRQPARASITLLEGLALPLGPPDKEFLQRFLWPFELSDDGSHLAREWTRVRDLHRFFPWFARSERARLPEELPDEKQLHSYVLDLFSAGPHYASAYAAVMRYQAQHALPRVNSRVVVMCREDDFLYRYLDALPENLPEQVRVERLTADRDAWRHRVVDLLRDGSEGSTAGFTLPDPLSGAAGKQEVRGYLNLAHGQVHVRRSGAGNKRPVLLLHETPGSGAALRPLAQELARDRQVIVLDLPGLGESDPLPNPDAAAHRELLVAVLDALGLISVDLVAEFTASPFAVDLARHASNRVHRLALDGVFQLTASERRSLWKSYCPGIRPSWDGAHLHAIWHRLRDQELSWPWYDRSKAAVRRREPDLAPDRLHALMLDVLKQLDHYGEACLAAVDYPVKDVLEEVRQPVLLLNAPEDVRYQWTRKIARRLADTETVVRANAVADRARQYAAFFDR